MKRFIIFIVILKGQILVAQIHSDSAKQVSVSTSIKQREEKLNAYADSIDKYKVGMLPNFLLNECFDWNASLWDGLHSPISLRWKILLRVKNKQALKTILDSRDKRIKLRCDHKSDKVYPYLSIPLIQNSFYDLIKKRYDQL